MIDVARIDLLAATGGGLFHRASVPAKLLMICGVVAAAVISRDPLPLAAGYCCLLAAAAAAALPWTLIAALSVYAALFGILYALSLGGDFRLFSLVILKAVTPAYALGIVITSTPYPRIFAALSRALPEVLAAGLFMTYRALFLLIDLMGHVMTAIRLRGGLSPAGLHRNGANLAKAIGMLLVGAVERSARLSAVMTVRGYNGSMAEAGAGGLRSADWLPLALGAVIPACAAALR